MNDRIKLGTAAGTGTFTISPANTFSTASTVSSSGAVTLRGSDLRPKDAEQIQNAIYAHLQALRSLGRSSVNTLEIAQALHISPARVTEALAALQAKGVRIPK